MNGSTPPPRAVQYGVALLLMVLCVGVVLTTVDGGPMRLAQVVAVASPSHMSASTTQPKTLARGRVLSDATLIHKHRHRPAPMRMDSFDAAQRALFAKHVADSKIYFEFGAGGSTDHVLRETHAHVYSLDSSREWLTKISRGRTLEDLARLTTIWSDIGELRNYGYPKDETRKRNWPLYSTGIAAYPEADVVFVDGRFRVACLCQAILHTAPGTTLMVHDWSRKQYHVILKHADVVAEASGNFAVLKAKQPVNREAVLEMWHEYKQQAAV